MNKVKNNYALLNAGDENSLFYSPENKSGIEKTKKINNILKDNFRKMRKNHSAILISRKNKTNSKQKQKLYKVKHSSLLNEIKKITPQMNLKYQIELYEQKGRYSLIKKDEIIDEEKYSGKNFLKSDYKDSYSYKTCLDLRGKTKFYSSRKKSLCYGKFRPLISKLKNKNKTELLSDENSFNNNGYTEINNNSPIILKANDKNILRPKSSTKTSTILSYTSRPFSAKIIGTSNNNKEKNKELLYFRKKCIKLKYKVDKTFDKASNASVELNKDIYESKNYDNLNKYFHFIF